MAKPLKISFYFACKRTPGSLEKIWKIRKTTLLQKDVYGKMFFPVLWSYNNWHIWVYIKAWIVFYISQYCLNHMASFLVGVINVIWM